MDAHTAETYKGLIQIGLSALRTITVLNGGAMIALLAYLGSGAGKAAPPNLLVPMLVFTGGLAVAGIAVILAYLMQLKLYGEGAGHESRGAHGPWLWGAVLSAGVSVLCFAVGAVLACIALSAVA